MFYYYLIFTFILTLFTFLENNFKKYNKGLLAAFLILFIITAIRYDFGYDYLMYEDEFRIINLTPSSNWVLGMKRLELGWVLLNKLFGFLGFYYLIAFLALLYCSVFYFFINTTLSKELYPIAILFFLITPGIFIIHQILLRQTVALLFLITAILLIKDKKNIIWSVVLVIIASLFHKSALLFLPVIFTKYLTFKKTYVYFLIILYFIIFAFSYFSFFHSIIYKIIDLFFQNYAHYLNEQSNDAVKINSGLGILFSLINFSIILYFRNIFLEKDFMKVIFFSTIIYYLLTPLSLINGEFLRLLVYFQVFLIIIIPLVFSAIKNKKLKYIYLITNILFSLHTLKSFFNNDGIEQKHNTYKTIFTEELKS